MDTSNILINLPRFPKVIVKRSFSFLFRLVIMMKTTMLMNLSVMLIKMSCPITINLCMHPDFVITRIYCVDRNQ